MPPRIGVKFSCGHEMFYDKPDVASLDTNEECPMCKLISEPKDNMPIIPLRDYVGKYKLL